MFAVGLDEFWNLILYSQLIGVKIENNKPFISNEVKEILFGSLLGDGKLELPPRGLNARSGFTQSYRSCASGLRVAAALRAEPDR